MLERLYDFHSHILPGMDDGYPDAESAVKALEESYAQGVRYMMATPHYYHEEPVDEFLERRRESMQRLQEAMAHHKGPLPEICLGAEVAYFPDIKLSEELPKLCYGESPYMLLEMPFRPWDPDVVRDVQNICNAGEVIPVLAHIERYLPIQDRGAVQQILNLDLHLQMNGEFFLERRSRRMAKKMLKDQPPYLFGTDCHNLSDRRPLLGSALAELTGSAMEEAIEGYLALSEEIWEQANGK